MRRLKKINPGISILSIIVVLFIGILVISQRLNREIDRITKKTAYKQKGQIEQHILEDGIKEHSKKSGIKNDLINQEKVIRKTRRDPRGEAYLESTFFKGREVVASYKELKGKIYDKTGKIPDGKVEFFDEVSKVKGEEFYQSGKRHGLYKEFYRTGRLKKEAQYYRGKLIKNKEYYANGILRLEQDFKSAIWPIRDIDNMKEGRGKFYYPDGTVEREWDFLNMNEKGYVKFYSKNGHLRTVDYYDEDGNPIESE